MKKKIVCLKETESNQNAISHLAVKDEIAYYPELQFDGTEDTLVLLDIDKNNTLQYFNPEDIGEECIKSGLTSNLKTLYIIASSTKQYNNLFQFANELASYFQQQLKCDTPLKVGVSSDRRCRSTIIYPPDMKNNNKWQIVSVTTISSEKNLKNSIFDATSQKLICEIEDIFDYLKKPAQQVTVPIDPSKQRIYFR